MQSNGKKLTEESQSFKQKSRIVLKKIFKKSFPKENSESENILNKLQFFFFLKKFEKVQILKPATKKQNILGRLNREDTFKSSKKLKLFYRGNHNVWQCTMNNFPEVFEDLSKVM